MPENGYSLPLNTLILISVLIKTTLEDRGLYQFFSLGICSLFLSDGRVTKLVVFKLGFVSWFILNTRNWKNMQATMT